MNIGTVSIQNITLLAPLAGITNLPFRLMAKASGCGLVCSEMISANGLVHNSKKTQQLLTSTPEEKPLSVQIFGSNPSVMAEAAKIVEASGADILDINFGCSVKKIVKTGAGVALMQDMKKTEILLAAVRNAIRIPLTIKLRTGWDRSGTQAFRLVEVAEACGVDAVCVHPRTAGQGFGGCADWSIISEVKRRVSIPVIGNGDVRCPEDVRNMLQSTGCDGVMIGRAAIGTPWIFSQVLDLLKGNDVHPITPTHRLAVMKQYVDASVAWFGEPVACRMMRSRLGWFVKGLHDSRPFRESLKHISTKVEAFRLIDSFGRSLEIVSQQIH